MPTFGVDYGLLLTGFVPLTTQGARDIINGGMQSAYGASFDVSDGSAAGQLAGIIAALFGELWEVAEQLSASMDPDKAAGAAQDAVCAITGTVRKPATYSTVFLTLSGTPTTVVPTGTQAQAASNSSNWQTLADATIAALPAWQSTHAYVAGVDRVTNASRTYVCITNGTSAGSGGPTTTALDITDGSAHWRYLGEGTGAVDTLSRATLTGPTVAVSGDVSIKITPVGGWQTVVNLLDATPGRAVETDEQLRVRRDQELAAPGASTAANIRALLLEMTGVVAAHVFVNDTDFTDADGVPPHAIEALVEGGDDQAIIDLLGEEVAAGIATYGTTSGTHVDSEGVSETVRFSRPEIINISVDVTLVKDAGTYAGDAAVKAAITAYGNAQLVIGKDVVATAIASAIFPVYINGVLVAGVAGLLNVPRSGSLGGVLLSSTPAPGTPAAPTTDATVVISTRQLAALDTSRITLHTSDGTP